MMGVKISTDWKFNDIQTIMMENEKFKVVIFPELGAKIWQITYKPKYKELLWNHPRIKPRKIPFHSIYDDTFFGGWDELYPNDIPEQLNGEMEPDHGEIWTLPWEYTIEKNTLDEVTVHLWVDTVISASRVEKWITLRSNESVLHFKHKITNTGQMDQPFLWKLHAAMAVDENCQVDLGAKRMFIEDFGPPRNGKTGISYDWPYAPDEEGNPCDMRNVLSEKAQINEFQYGTELKDGWCAVTNTKDQVGFGLIFDQRVFRSCWLFATYGGWRNLNTVILEPCTGYPVSVNDGIQNETHQTLQAGHSLECEVKAVIYEDFELFKQEWLREGHKR
jgi:hypothetical protein